MKYFYDTEFLEGPQTKRFLGIPIGKTKPTIDLISIGIVSEDNREYYAVSKDFNLDEAWNRYDVQEQTTYEKQNGFSGRKVYWIRENVLMPIFFDLAMLDFHNIHFKDEWLYEGKEVTLDVFKSHKTWSTNKKWFKKLLNKYGKSNKQIADDVFRFINRDSLSLDKARFYKTKYDTVDIYGYYSAYDHVVFCWLFGLMKDLPSGLPMYTRDLKQISDEVYAKKKEEYIATGGGNFISKLSKHLDYPKQANEHNALSDAKWNKELHEFLNKHMNDDIIR